MAQHDELQLRACRIRQLLLQMIYEAGSGHPGGSLSAVDILTHLFFRELKLDPNYPTWDGRDRFILSKGHAVPALYAVGVERGWLPKDEIMGFRKINRILQGHIQEFDESKISQLMKQFQFQDLSFAYPTFTTGLELYNEMLTQSCEEKVNTLAQVKWSTADFWALDTFYPCFSGSSFMYSGIRAGAA